MLNLLPFAFALRLARPAGVFLFWLLRRQRLIALENLRKVYGAEKSEAEIQKIARESFVHLAEFGVEWLRMPQIAKRSERYLRIKNTERVYSALEKKRGAIIFLSHNGNWEIMALIGGLLLAQPIRTPIYALARPLKNPYVYNRVIHLRELTGLQSIKKIGAVRETLACLKKNGIVCLLIDQRISEGSVKTKFFGREALTTSLPAITALRLGTPIFFTFVERTSDLRYVLDFEGPFPIEDTGDPERDIRVNTQRFNDHIEAEIRKDPSRWLWMHNRWRLEGEAKD